MTLHRAFVLRAVIVLALSSLSAPAWAHPGHTPTAESAGGEPARLESPDSFEMGSPGSASATSRSAPRHRGPSAVALLAGALVLLASLPDRRRTLGLALALLLGTAVSEGAVHALLHLKHLAHSDGLAVGHSAAQQAGADLQRAMPATISLPLLGRAAPQRRPAPLTEVAVAPDRGRAPPVSPA